MIYDAFKKELISEFELVRDRLVVKAARHEPESLFGIKSDNAKLYTKILAFFEMTLIKNISRLVSDLCNVKGIPCAAAASGGSMFDLEIEFNGKPQLVAFKTQPNAMNSASRSAMLHEISAAGKPANLVFLLKDGCESQRSIRRMERDAVRCFLFEGFLEALFGADEKRAFQDAMEHFTEEIHNATGYQAMELCSPYNLQKFKEELSSELLNFPYEAIKNQRYMERLASEQNARDLNRFNFSIIKDSFVGGGRYQLLLGDSDFAESFKTSEWLYKKYLFLDRLDNTFVISGYLKSIEQLLWDIIYIIGQGRSIGNTVISETNEDEIDKTLGSLQYFLGNRDNDDLFQNAFGSGKYFVMSYLRNQITDWRRQYRNGYFHKHNLNDRATIQAVREETYFLYLLILGTIELMPADINRLMR